MRTIAVRRTLAISPEQAFDVLADHAGYAKFAGIQRAALIRPGAPEPNGVGALRKLSTGPIWFVEEITAFERPRWIEYRIVESPVPIAHERGRITFTPVARGVEVVWTSTFQIALPLIGRIATAVAARPMSVSLASMLRATEKRAQAAPR